MFGSYGDVDMQLYCCIYYEFKIVTAISKVPKLWPFHERGTCPRFSPLPTEVAEFKGQHVFPYLVYSVWISWPE